MKRSIIHTIVTVLVVLFLLDTCNDEYRPQDHTGTVLIDSLLQERLYRLEDSLGREKVRYQVLTISAKDFIASQNNEIEELKKKLIG